MFAGPAGCEHASNQSNDLAEVYPAAPVRQALGVPELPEVEITARRLDAALHGARVESALAPGMNTMKTFEPPIGALAGRAVSAVRRVGKMPVVEFSAEPGGEPLALLIHLMSAGRLQVFDKPASPKDRASRLLLRLDDGRELRLREFGTKQRAWAKLMAPGEVRNDEMVATLGPEAWPPPPLERFAELIDQPRHLHPLLRDQRLIAGIGRSWVDEVLWEARLSPFKKGSELDEEEIGRLHAGLSVLGDAIETYEDHVGDRVPEKLPMPLRVHRREGQPCPRCGETIEAVFFSEHQTNYCPREQTGGRVLKDRRLSRLLK
jgi:formamidopyrimidine-DNA glycosylase